MTRQTIAQRSGGLARCRHPEPVPGCAACDLYARFPWRFRPEPGDPPPAPVAAVKKPCGCKDCDCPEEP